MKHESLSTTLSRRPAGSVVWTSPAGSATAGELARLPSVWGKIFAGRSVALALSHKANLATALIALDGLAKDILLLPPDLDESVRTKFIEDFSDPILLTNTSTFPIDSGDRATMAADAPTNWYLTTSGTTGTPKKIRHTRESLFRTVKHTVSPKPNFIWGLLYDLHRFAGLQVFFQAVVGGGQLLFVEDNENLPTAIQFYLSQGVTALSATPTFWRKILMSPQRDQLHLQQITLGGEIADDKILSALKSTYPHSRLVHIYASTEAGVGFRVEDGRAGFPASWLKEGYRGTRLRMDDVGLLYIDSGAGEISTGDLVRKVGDRIFFLGRESGAINVGGNKVMPEEIESVLLDMPGVSGARVSAKKSAFTGALVQAEVMATPTDEKKFLKDLEAHCRSRLEPFKVPAHIQIVKSITTNSMGKITRDK